METNNNLNNLKTNEITIVSILVMDKLSVGDIFLFTADGPKYVYLGRTPDNNVHYENKAITTATIPTFSIRAHVIEVVVRCAAEINIFWTISGKQENITDGEYVHICN